MRLLIKQRVFSWSDTYDIYDEEGNSVESAPHPQQKLFVDLGGEAEVYDILRRSEA